MPPLLRQGIAAVMALSLAWNTAFTQQTPAPVAELTAEGYRDLILNTADAMHDLAAYGQVTKGTGSTYVEGRQVPCIVTFTTTEAAAQDIATRRKAWSSARVPEALAASHAEIDHWMKLADTMASVAPKCFVPFFQQSKEQLEFMALLGGYDRIRENATSALAGMGVALPPLEKK